MNALRVMTPIAVLALALTVAAPAYARRGPCRHDIEALCPSVTPGPGSARHCLKLLCPDVTPGPGAFGACLKQHESQLSPACQQHLNRMEAKRAAFRQACQADVQTFCGDVKPGHGDLRRCLRQHRDELSQPCKDLLAQHKRQHHHPTPAAPPQGESNPS